MVISTVGWLILAIVGLVVIYIFLSQLVPAVGEFMDAVVGGIVTKFCDQLGILSGICHLITGK